MADYHVQTGQDFISRANSLTNTDTIILDNDIDLNFTTGQITIKCNIDGNGKSIYNLQSTTYNINFATNSDISVSNVCFKNILGLSGNDFATRNSTGKTTFTNCQFQGKCGSITTKSMLFRKCYFELTLINNSYVALNSDYEYCYFDIKSFKITTGRYGLFGNSLLNCYVKGNIEITFSYHGFSNSVSYCVFNFNLTLSGDGSISAPTKGAINVYNSDKMSVSSVNQYIVACTDAELHDAQAIANKGFPIIVG